ncbi:MAG: vitamin K epoxide reductase family protein [Acidobacteria bacterium]|nr:vitamin K epoxide reductase family protein [Acidobacteriota bacterium]
MENAKLSLWRRPALIYGLAMLLSLVGLLDSIYLTVQHLAGKSVKCTVTDGCSKVLSSSYATVAGMPTASFGAMAYFTAFSLATLAAFGSQQARTWLAVLIVPMILTTCWLFYLQAFVLHAFCEFCLLSATMSSLLTLLAFLGWRSQTDRLHSSD